MARRRITANPRTNRSANMKGRSISRASNIEDKALRAVFREDRRRAHAALMRELDSELDRLSRESDTGSTDSRIRVWRRTA